MSCLFFFTVVVDDYNSPSTGTIRVRPILPGMVSLQGNGDQISQEGDETFTLGLTLSSGAFPSGVFLRDELTVVIIDSTCT